jgi:hypothetical protein
VVGIAERAEHHGAETEIGDFDAGAPEVSVLHRRFSLLWLAMTEASGRRPRGVETIYRLVGPQPRSSAGGPGLTVPTTTVPVVNFLVSLRVRSHARTASTVKGIR